MKPQLYLAEHDRKYLKEQIERYFSFLKDGLDFFNDKLEKWEPELEELKKRPRWDFIDNNSDDISDIYDYRIEYSQHYCSFYEQFLWFCFVQLYHFREKQVRWFLYKEMNTDIESIKRKKKKKTKQTGIKDFFKEEVTSLENIKVVFKKYGINIEKYSKRDTILLLNRINNAYKHGWWLSVKKIQELVINEHNLDVTLKVDKKLLIKCNDAIYDFRDFIPKRTHLI